MRMQDFHSDTGTICAEYRFAKYRGKLFSALFNNAFSCLDYIASTNRMTMNWKGCERKRS